MVENLRVWKALEALHMSALRHDLFLRFDWRKSLSALQSNTLRPDHKLFNSFCIKVLCLSNAPCVLKIMCLMSAENTRQYKVTYEQALSQGTR